MKIKSVLSKLLTFNFQLSTQKGFTLIELLIVIAILGVLAAGVLVALDPVEQLSRGRDAGRKSVVGQIGRAFQAYYTSNSVYPTIGQWTGTPTTNVLVTSGEIKVIPTQNAPTPVTACGGGALVNNFCYKVDVSTSNMVFYTHVESKSEKNKCVDTSGNNTWYVYASIDGRSGIVCQAAEPNATTSYTYL